MTTVTVRSAVRELHRAAGRLRDAALELELIAVEDRPRDSVHLVDVVHNDAFEVSGEAEQAVATLTAIAGRTGSLPPQAVTPAVAECTAHANRLGKALGCELSSPERLADLAGLTGLELRTWATEVTRSVTACQRLLWTDFQPALLTCWIELVERLESPAPALRTRPRPTGRHRR